IVLPPSRTKNKREHIVPLSTPALDILRRYGGEDRVFPSLSWSDRKEALDRRCGLQHFTLHDLRRTMATMLGDLGFAAPHAIEQILNHVSGHKAGVAGIYNKARYEKECREALERWAHWVEDLG